MRLMYGDCLEKLQKVKDKSVDCIIIDPPFSGSISRTKGGGGRFTNYHIMYNNLSERAFYLFIKPIFIQCFRVLKEGGHFYCFTDWSQLRNMMDCIELSSLNILNLLCWDKLTMGMGNGYRRQEEYIIVGSRSDAKPFNLRNVSSVIKVKRINYKKRLHPYEKPLDLLEIFVNNSTNKGQVVLDCFMGSGTVGVVCKRTKRKFIGIEINKKYFNVAKKRLKSIIF